MKIIWESCRPIGFILDKLRRGIPDSREEQPRFADCCDWEKLGGQDWRCLLTERQEFERFMKPKTNRSVRPSRRA